MQQAAEFLANTRAHPALRYSAVVTHDTSKFEQDVDFFGFEVLNFFHDAFYHLLRNGNLHQEVSTKKMQSISAEVIAMQELYIRLKSAQTLGEILTLLPSAFDAIDAHVDAEVSQKIQWWIRLRLIKAHAISYVWNMHTEQKQHQLQLDSRDNQGNVVQEQIKREDEIVRFMLYGSRSDVDDRIAA